METDTPTLGSGRFTLIEPLGLGTRGGVFLAHDHLRKDLCAVKVIDEHNVPPEAVARFLAEARVLGNLRHTHLVPARAAGNDKDLYWYAMDLLPGGNLQDLLKARGRVPGLFALAITFQVLLALDALHQAGLVHRDIKLTNVMLDRQGNACLTDLGVAHHPGGSVDFQTLTGQELGTPGYGAPEQWDNAKQVGPPADIFSTGVLLYRLLTKRPAQRLHLGHYRPTLLDELPAPISKVLVAATQVLPASRYASARVMAEALIDAALAIDRDLPQETWRAQLDSPGPPDPWTNLRAWITG